MQALPLAGNIQYNGFHGRVDAEAHLSIPDAEFGIRMRLSPKSFT